jgi:hypothetical protein
MDKRDAYRTTHKARCRGTPFPRAAAPESATYRRLGARTHERRRPRTCAHIDVRHATEVPVRHASGDAPTVRSKFGECFSVERAADADLGVSGARAGVYAVMAGMGCWSG